jgi:hypothetical protein
MQAASKPVRQRTLSVVRVGSLEARGGGSWLGWHGDRVNSSSGSLHAPLCLHLCVEVGQAVDAFQDRAQRAQHAVRRQRACKGGSYSG